MVKRMSSDKKYGGDSLPYLFFCGEFRYNTDRYNMGVKSAKLTKDLRNNIMIDRVIQLSEK